MEKERIRNCKFTGDEIHLVVQLVEKYKVDKITMRIFFKEIIENKQTNRVSQRDKKICWENITDLFNNASRRPSRKVNELKLKWENLKKLTRKKVALKKQVENSTSDGVLNEIEFTAEELKIMNLIGLSTDGLVLQYDENRTDDHLNVMLSSSSNIEFPELDEISNEMVDYKTNCTKEETVSDTPFYIKLENVQDDIETSSNFGDIPQTSDSPPAQLPKRTKHKFKEFIPGKKEVARLRAAYFSKKRKIIEDSYSSKQKRLEELHEEQLAVLRAKRNYYEEKTKKLRERKSPAN